MARGPARPGSGGGYCPCHRRSVRNGDGPVGLSGRSSAAAFGPDCAKSEPRLRSRAVTVPPLPRLRESLGKRSRRCCRGWHWVAGGLRPARHLARGLRGDPAQPGAALHLAGGGPGGLAGRAPGAESVYVRGRQASPGLTRPRDLCVVSCRFDRRRCHLGAHLPGWERVAFDPPSAHARLCPRVCATVLGPRKNTAALGGPPKLVRLTLGLQMPRGRGLEG